jgi:hypothetical protein
MYMPTKSTTEQHAEATTSEDAVATPAQSTRQCKKLEATIQSKATGGAVSYEEGQEVLVLFHRDRQWYPAQLGMKQAHGWEVHWEAGQTTLNVRESSIKPVPKGNRTNTDLGLKRVDTIGMKEQRFGKAAYAGRNRAVKHIEEEMTKQEKDLFNAFAYGIPFETTESTPVGAVVHRWEWVPVAEVLTKAQTKAFTAGSTKVGAAQGSKDTTSSKDMNDNVDESVAAVAGVTEVVEQGEGGEQMPEVLSFGGMTKQSSKRTKGMLTLKNQTSNAFGKGGALTTLVPLGSSKAPERERSHRTEYTGAAEMKRAAGEDAGVLTRKMGRRRSARVDASLLGEGLKGTEQHALPDSTNRFALSAMDGGFKRLLHRRVSNLAEEKKAVVVKAKMELTVGELVKIVKKGSYEGRTAVVTEGEWFGRVKVKLVESHGEGAVKSYKREEIQLQKKVTMPCCCSSSTCFCSCCYCHLGIAAGLSHEQCLMLQKIPLSTTETAAQDRGENGDDVHAESPVIAAGTGH